MLRGRRHDDNTELTVLLRVTYDGQELYEGEVQPGHSIEVGDLKLEVLWIRHHTDALPADLP